MKYSILQVKQGTEEWLFARAGRVTGSEASNVIDFKKNKEEGAARRKYREKIMSELLTGEPDEAEFVTKWMREGAEKEPYARMAYEAEAGVIVRETGFLAADDYAIGCSLDGDINDFNGILELKCPKKNTHLRYLDEGILPEEYQAQVIHNLWVSGAQWCDFGSYHEKFPKHLQLFLRRTYRKDVAQEIADYEKQVFLFLKEVNEKINKLMGKDTKVAA